MANVLRKTGKHKIYLGSFSAVLALIMMPAMVAQAKQSEQPRDGFKRVGGQSLAAVALPAPVRIQKQKQLALPKPISTQAKLPAPLAIVSMYPKPARVALAKPQASLPKPKLEIVRAPKPKLGGDAATEAKEVSASQILQAANHVKPSTIESADSQYPYRHASVESQSIQIPVNNSASSSSKRGLSAPAKTTKAEKSDQPFSLNSALGLKSNSRIKVNGFLSVGALKTNVRERAGLNPKYIIPEQGSVGDEFNFAAASLLGLQIRFKINNELNAVAQFVADGDNTNGNNPYNLEVEYAYLSYQPTANTHIRAGRFRLPLFIYSETQQVGYSYPWIFLPNAVYAIAPTDNMNGIDSIYRLDLFHSGWVLKVQPFLGMNNSKQDLYTQGAPIPGVPLPQGTTANFDEKGIYGITASITSAFLTIRGSYAHMRVSAYVPSYVTPNGAVRLQLFNNEPVHVFSLGAKVDYRHFLLLGEFAHRSTPNEITSLSGFYGTLGYHFSKFLPTLTYGRIWTTNTSQLASQTVAELPTDQQTFTLALAYYLNSNLVAKLSVSDILPLNGTNGLFTANPGRRHILLYGAALDAIF